MRAVCTGMLAMHVGYALARHVGDTAWVRQGNMYATRAHSRYKQTV